MEGEETYGSDQEAFCTVLNNFSNALQERNSLFELLDEIIKMRLASSSAQQG